MYLDFFKFKKNPFHITPDPDFLFLSPSHREASASIFYGIEQRKGFVAVTGEVGVGKTTILRSYLEGTDSKRIRIVYVFNATLTFEQLLKQIISELGIPAVDDDPAQLVDSLFRYLIDEYKDDRNVVLIIDEAQNMPVETLERLRMLSNLETSQDKLLQIILVGQPEFEQKLNLPELRQLKQRIAIRCRINALKSDESVAYIQHRLMKASSFHNPVFTKGAMKRIVKQAGGIPRIINIMCDNALVTAFGYQRKPVDIKIIKEVTKDLRGGRRALFSRWKFVWVPALMVFLGLIVLTSRSLLSPVETPTVRTEILSEKASKPPPAAEMVQKPGTEPPVANVSKVKTDVAVPEVKPADEKTSKTEPEYAAPEVKRTEESAPKTEPKPAVAEVKPPVSIVPKQEPKPAVAEVKPPVSIVPKQEPKPAVAEVKPPVAIAPKAEPKPAVAEVKPPITIGPMAKPEPSAAENVATGNDNNTSKIASESTVAPAQPSVKPPPITPVTETVPKKTLPARMIKRGDSVSKLLMDTCGRVDDDLLKTVKDLNPEINDVNVIREGKEIILPNLQQKN